MILPPTVTKNFIKNNEMPFCIHYIDKSTENGYTHMLLVGAAIGNFLKGNICVYITTCQHISFYIKELKVLFPLTRNLVQWSWSQGNRRTY